MMLTLALIACDAVPTAETGAAVTHEPDAAEQWITASPRPVQAHEVDVEILPPGAAFGALGACAYAVDGACFSDAVEACEAAGCEGGCVMTASVPMAPVCAEAPVADPVVEVPSGVVGAWRSASCGDRTWERELMLYADGVFVMRDRVAPCPEGATCVWSGVEEAEGRWAELAGVLVLAAYAPEGQPPEPPTVLMAWTGGVAELSPDGAACVYQAM